MMVDYENKMNLWYNDAIARAMARFPGAAPVMVAKREKAISKVDDDRDQKIAKRDEAFHKFELEFEAKRDAYNKEARLFQDRQATCLGVFHSTLSESVRNRVGALLQQSRFREAWHNLCEFYSPAAGGQSTIETVYQYYQSSVWRFGTLGDHINMMDRLADNAVAAGHAVMEPTRIYNLLRSIEQSTHQEYKSQIEFLRNMNASYVEIVDRLERRSHELLVTKEINRMTGSIRVNEVNEEVSAVAVPVSHKDKRHRGKKKEKETKKSASNVSTRSTSQKCENCGRLGHRKADCYLLKPCMFCQGDHNPLWCTENPDKGDKEKLRERRERTEVSHIAVAVGEPTSGQQVNLSGRFQALNPRP
jgi:hypothetical protein